MNWPLFPRPEGERPGWVAATAGSGSGLAIADIDLSVTHDKTLTAHVHLLTDRRVDLY